MLDFQFNITNYWFMHCWYLLTNQYLIIHSLAFIFATNWTLAVPIFLMQSLSLVQMSNSDFACFVGNFIRYKGNGIGKSFNWDAHIDIQYLDWIHNRNECYQFLRILFSYLNFHLKCRRRYILYLLINSSSFIVKSMKYIFPFDYITLHLISKKLI